MANYPAPTELLPAFTPSVFETNNIPLTIEEGEKYFLTYPVAQGAQTIPTLSTGTLSVSGTLTSTLDSHNLGFGYQALSAAVAGSAVDNTAFGYQALKALTLGDSNTAVGDLALPILTGASAVTVKNTAVGHQSGRFLAEGTDNTFVGFNAGAGSSSHIGCNFNTAVGSGAGGVLSTGDNNTCVGFGAGDTITSGINNTCIGYNADVNNLGASFRTAIGSGVTVNTDNTITLGRVNSDKVELNKITPMYTSIASAAYAIADVGFLSAPTITYPGATTNVIASLSSVPIGTYLVIVMLNMAAGGPAILNVRGDSTVQGFIPAVTRTTEWYSGSVITRITSLGTIDVLPLAAGSSGADGGATGQSIRIYRIA